MSDDGSTKDDVKLPDGEVGDKINKLFTEDGKDTSESSWNTILQSTANIFQTSLSSLLWVRRLASTPRRLPSPRLASLQTQAVSGSRGVGPNSSQKFGRNACIFACKAGVLLVR
jgi:hypothetical protein